MSTSVQNGYSARTLVELIVDGESIPVAQVGPDKIWLREQRDGLENRMGLLIVTIGSSQRQQDIMLTHHPTNDPREIGYY